MGLESADDNEIDVVNLERDQDQEQAQDEQMGPEYPLASAVEEDVCQRANVTIVA